MENSLNNLKKATEDINTLLALSLAEAGREHKNQILRSAVVLIVASWEQFIEQLAESSVELIANRLRDSEAIPEEVKQNIAIHSVVVKRENKRDFSDSVWRFSDKGWKQTYISYCKDLTSKINSASSDRVISLYKSILGINDITSPWLFKLNDSRNCSGILNDIVNMRHDIAHGANNRSDELTDIYVNDAIEFIVNIATITLNVVSNHIFSFWKKGGLIYPLNMAFVPDLILLGMEKPDGIITLEEIKGFGPTAQGNHNKLCNMPWGLLEPVNKRTRKITDRLMKFYNGEIKLPKKIMVFANKDAIPAPNTSYISFEELLNVRDEAINLELEQGDQDE